MKKILSSILMLMAVAFVSTSVTSCKDDDMKAGYNSPALNTGTGLSESTAVKPNSIVTFTGVCLDNVQRVEIGGFNAEIVSQAFKELKFKVPMGDFEEIGAQKSKIEVFSKQTEGKIIYNNDFWVFRSPAPIPDNAANSGIQTPTSNKKVGDKVTLVGQMMDQYTKVVIGGVEAPIISKSETELTITIVNGTYTAGKAAIIVVDITGYYGDPEMSNTIFGGFRLDPTFVAPPTKPSISNVTPEDGGTDNNKFYLKKKVTITGSSIDLITGIEVGGAQATILEGTTANALTFVMPDSYTFTEPTACDFEAISDGGRVKFIDKTETTTLVYPFYYWKDVKVGAQGADWTTCGAFFVPDEGKVYTPEQWYDTPLDKNAKRLVNSTTSFDNMTMSAANTLNKANVSKDEYYDVKPYFFFTSGTDMAIQSPSNSTSQLRNFKRPYDGGFYSIIHNPADPKAQFSATGTPIIQYRVLFEGSSAADKAYYDAVKNGTITNLDEYTSTVAGSGAPKFNATTPATSAFNVGCVVLMQHFTYTGGKTATMDAVYKSGFVHIKDMTDIVGGKGTPTTVMTIDCYWPAKARGVTP